MEFTMLVLSRRNNEKIVLPGLGITITILESKSNKVSIGIDAPREVQITRPGAPRPTGLRRIVTVSNGKSDNLPADPESRQSAERLAIGCR